MEQTTLLRRVYLDWLTKEIVSQTKYTNPYYGPKVGGLYDELAYHSTFDVYYKKIILGVQLSVEELATIKEHAGNIIKNLDAY